VRSIESVKDVFLLLHNPICRVLQGLHETQPVKIIDRTIENFTVAGLKGWNIFEDGNVDFEGAGRKCHQKGNVVAEISKLACVTGRTLCGKVSCQVDVINVAKRAGGVVVAVFTSCLAMSPGADAVFRAGREVVRAEKASISSVRCVRVTAGTVIIACYGIHITKNLGGAVAV